MAAQEKRKEFCAILGVEEQASKEEIKRAYKQLALQCHPDKNQLNPEATKEFQKISEAYTGLCQEDIDSADEDINVDGGVSLLELLQLFFSINRRKPFFMRSPSSWFSRYSEDSDEVNDSDDACGPMRQNIRNHAGQQAWNDDNHFVPGTARTQSSSKDTGKTGKAKKRKNRKGGGGGAATASSPNANNTSDRQGTAGAGTNASTGSDTGARTSAGTAENRTRSAVDQEGLATSENQWPGRAGVNDQGANQGGGGDTKSDIAEPATDNNSSGENSERRGSNGSLGTAQLSHGQAAEKKPNKKKLQAEQRIREKECAEIHRAVLEKNQREEEKRKKKAEREKARLDLEFAPKLNAMTREENKTTVSDCPPEINPSPAERQDDHCEASVQMNDAKDPETSDTASLDSDAGLVKQIEDGLSLESSETVDSVGTDAMNNNERPGNDRKVSAASFGEERFDENHTETASNGDAVGSNQSERQKFTRVFYGHSSKNQNKNNRFNRNFDNADGGTTTGGHFPPPQRGSGYRGRIDNPNYRPHANNSGFVDRSFYRGFHGNSERAGLPNNDDHASEEASSNAGFKDSSGRGNRGQYGRGRYHGNKMHYQNSRHGNTTELPDDQSVSRNCDGPGRDLDRSNGVVALDVKLSGECTSQDSTPNDLPSSEFQSRRGTNESSVQEGLLPCNGHKGGYAPDNSETSKRGYWSRPNRNSRGQRGYFRGGFDGGGRNRGDDPSGGFRSKPVQECWDSEISENCESRLDQIDNITVEMPVAERGRGQHRGRRPDRGGSQRGGAGRAFNSSNSQENWDLEGCRGGNLVDQAESAKDMPVHEPYRGSRPERGRFQRDARGRGRGKGFSQTRDSRPGEGQPRGNSRAADWEPGKKRFERGFTYEDEEYNGATMQFHRRKQQTSVEAAQVPFRANDTSHQHQSETAAASDGMVWTRRSSESDPSAVSGPRNVWKDRQEFYEGALPRSEEEEDAMLRAALQLSELEIEERRLSEQVQSASRSLSFTSSSAVSRPSEAGWTADVLETVTVEPHRQRPADNAATDNSHVRLQPENGQTEDSRRKIGGTSDEVERIVSPTCRLKSWADEMEETNDAGANDDANLSDSVAESDANPVRSPHLRGKTIHNSWALMNFGAPSDVLSSEQATTLPPNREVRAVESIVEDEIVYPTAPEIPQPLTPNQIKAVFDSVLRPKDMPCTLEAPLQRQTSMLDDVDDGAEEKGIAQNMPPASTQAAADVAVESRNFQHPPFPPIERRHLREPEIPPSSGFSAENSRGEAAVDPPQSPGMPCPTFQPGPVPWMQPGCPTPYFFTMPGYPPWYPMPPYQHYWPCMPSGAQAMPGGVMPMVSQSLSLAHSSSLPDQSTVGQVLPMQPPPNSLHLQGPSAVPGLQPSMYPMFHPIPFGYPPHPGHFAPPGAAMHVPPFAPYPMPPSETVDSPPDLFQQPGSPMNYTDESKRCP